MDDPQGAGDILGIDQDVESPTRQKCLCRRLPAGINIVHQVGKDADLRFPLLLLHQRAELLQLRLHLRREDPPVQPEAPDLATQFLEFTPAFLLPDRDGDPAVVQMVTEAEPLLLQVLEFFGDPVLGGLGSADIVENLQSLRIHGHIPLIPEDVHRLLADAPERDKGFLHRLALAGELGNLIFQLLDRGAPLDDCRPGIRVGDLRLLLVADRLLLLFFQHPLLLQGAVDPVRRVIVRVFLLHIPVAGKCHPAPRHLRALFNEDLVAVLDLLEQLLLLAEHLE